MRLLVETLEKNNKTHILVGNQERLCTFLARFFVRVHVAHLFSYFVLSHYVSLRFEFRVAMSVVISARIKTMFVSSLLPVVCRRGHFLFMLFVFVCA